MSNPQLEKVAAVAAEVMAKHRIGIDDWDRFLSWSICTCRGCSKRFGSVEEYEEHVADLVAQAAVDALELTEQWSVEGVCSEADDCDHFGDRGPWTCEVIAETREEAAAYPIARSPGAYLVSWLITPRVAVGGSNGQP